MKNRHRIACYFGLLLLAVAPLSAQVMDFSGGDSAHTSKFEIAVISYINSFHEKMVYGADDEFVRKNYYAPGLAMRFHRKHLSFRTSFVTYGETYDFEPSTQPANGFSGPFFEPAIPFEVASTDAVLQKTYETKFGIQVALFEKRLSSYLFMDAGYRYVSEKRFYTFIQNPGPSQITWSAMEKASQRYAALHAGLGLRYQFTPWLFCAYECSMSGGISARKSNRKGRESSSATLFNYVPALFLMGLYF